ncbi:MAG: riboflavin synthase [Planctomycetes bacterium]|nr:riboflavin synthase [Planctomycetota bacterium]
MFTGLIEAQGVVVAADRSPGGNLTLKIDAGSWAHCRAGVSPSLGESIAVDGCCLTVAEQPSIERPALLTFHVIPESLARTTLDALAVGSRVHLEASCTPTTLLGGHIVQGHIDGVGEVKRVVTQGEWRITIAPPAALMPYIIPKGSIAVAGVSLTIAAIDVQTGTFDIALIPTTLDKTTLGRLKPGSRINLECDSMAKTMVHWLTHYADSGMLAQILAARS